MAIGLFESRLVGTSPRPEDRQRCERSARKHDADEGFSPLAIRPARAGRLRSGSDLLGHDRREGCARAHARRRQDRDRHLSFGHDGQAPCPLGLLDPQQGPAGPRPRRGVADPSGMVDAVDRSGGSRRHALFRRAWLRARHRKSSRHRQIGGRRLARVRQLRSDRMDCGAALVRRQCRNGGHFRLRRRAAHGGEAQSAASQGDLPVRSARRLWRSRRLPRRVSWRRHPSVSVSAAGLRLGASAERTAEAASAGKRKAMAGGDRQSRLQDVSARLQRAGAQRPTLPGLFRHSYRSLRQGGGGREKRGRVLQDQHPHLYRLGLVRLHLQDPPQRRAKLVSQHQGAAQETSPRRPGPSRPASQGVPQ